MFYLHTKLHYSHMPLSILVFSLDLSRSLSPTVPPGLCGCHSPAECLISCHVSWCHILQRLTSWTALLWLYFPTEWLLCDTEDTQKEEESKGACLGYGWMINMIMWYSIDRCRKTLFPLVHYRNSSPEAGRDPVSCSRALRQGRCLLMGIGKLL